MINSIDLIREEVEDAFAVFLPHLVQRLSERLLFDTSCSTQRCTNEEKQAIAYINENHFRLKQQWMARMHVYYHIKKCKTFIALFTECLQENPAYVPRKFRGGNDRIIKKMDIKRMNSELEVLRICKESFVKRLNKGDEEVEDMLKSSTSDVVVNTEILKLWKEVVEQDERTIDLKWSRKAQCMKIAYNNDKKNLSKTTTEVNTE